MTPEQRAKVESGVAAVFASPFATIELRRGTLGLLRVFADMRARSPGNKYVSDVIHRGLLDYVNSCMREVGEAREKQSLEARLCEIEHNQAIVVHNAELRATRNASRWQALLSGMPRAK